MDFDAFIPQSGSATPTSVALQKAHYVAPGNVCCIDSPSSHSQTMADEPDVMSNLSNTPQRVCCSSERSFLTTQDVEEAGESLLPMHVALQRGGGSSSVDGEAQRRRRPSMPIRRDRNGSMSTSSQNKFEIEAHVPQLNSTGSPLLRLDEESPACLSSGGRKSTMTQRLGSSGSIVSPPTAGAVLRPSTQQHRTRNDDASASLRGKESRAIARPPFQLKRNLFYSLEGFSTPNGATGVASPASVSPPLPDGSPRENETMHSLDNSGPSSKRVSTVNSGVALNSERKEEQAADEALDSDDEEVCCICLEGYPADNPKFEGVCKHHFHLPCLMDWKQRSNACPMCCSETLQGVGCDEEVVPHPAPAVDVSMDEEYALRLQMKYARKQARARARSEQLRAEQLRAILMSGSEGSGDRGGANMAATAVLVATTSMATVQEATSRAPQRLPPAGHLISPTTPARDERGDGGRAGGRRHVRRHSPVVVDAAQVAAPQEPRRRQRVRPRERRQRIPASSDENHSSNKCVVM